MLFFVVLLVVGVLGLAAVAAVVLSSANREVAALENGIASGDTTGLTELTPESLASLSKDVVGRVVRARHRGGARSCRLALTVPSHEGPSTLLALNAESSPRGSGRIDMLSQGPRLGLVLQDGVWHVDVDGKSFGAIDSSTGRLDDSLRGNVGFYRRTAQGVHVHVSGADVAWIDSDATLHRRMPEQPRPLLRLASPSPDPDAALWALAIVGVQLTAALMPPSR